MNLVCKFTLVWKCEFTLWKTCSWTLQFDNLDHIIRGWDDGHGKRKCFLLHIELNVLKYRCASPSFMALQAQTGTHIGGITDAWWVGVGLTKMCRVFKKNATYKTVEKKSHAAVLQTDRDKTGSGLHMKNPQHWMDLSSRWVGLVFVNLTVGVSILLVLGSKWFLWNCFWCWMGSFGRSSTWGERRAGSVNVPQREHTPGYSDAWRWKNTRG